MDDLHYAMQDFHRLTEANDALQAQVEQRDGEIAALREEVERLKEENKRIERVATKYYKALRGEGE
jgi:predicted nuclease with TOPRIM domain